MKTASTSAGLIVRLEIGDYILSSIETACSEHGIHNAEVTGLGSAEKLTLAHYRRDTKKFTERQLDGIYEVVSLIGNVSLVDGQPFAHCHIAVSDAAMTVFGGHLARGVCSATLELMIRPLPTAFTKAYDDDIGLKLWNLAA